MPKTGPLLNGKHRAAPSVRHILHQTCHGTQVPRRHLNEPRAKLCLPTAQFKLSKSTLLMYIRYFLAAIARRKRRRRQLVPDCGVPLQMLAYRRPAVRKECAVQKVVKRLWPEILRRERAVAQVGSARQDVVPARIATWFVYFVFTYLFDLNEKSYDRQHARCRMRRSRCSVAMYVTVCNLGSTCAQTLAAMSATCQHAPFASRSAGHRPREDKRSCFQACAVRTSRSCRCRRRPTAAETPQGHTGSPCTAPRPTART